VSRQAEQGKDVSMDFGLSDIWWVLGKLQATKKFVLAGGKTVSPRLTVSQMRLKCGGLATACRGCAERVEGGK